MIGLRKNWILFQTIQNPMIILMPPGLELEHHINPNDDADSDTFLMDAYIPIKKPSI